jgi:hypothetical protein
MEQYVAYTDSDANFAGDFDGIDSKQNAEIWFLPSITLDNGIKFGANVQLEALTGGDQIDEAFVFIKGSFGEILLGSENSAGYKMTYAAPDVTFININSGSSFSGLQVGASYARDGQQDTNAQVDSDVENSGFPTDIFDIGANYVNSFGGIDLALSGRCGTGNDHSGSDATVWSGGSASASAASPSAAPTPSRTATATAAVTATPLMPARPT